MMAIILVGTAMCALMVGMLLGRSAGQNESAQRAEDAYRRGQEEAEVEKTNLALELGDHLLKMRSSIQETVEAYHQTVRVVQEKLALSPEVAHHLAFDRLTLTTAPADDQLESAALVEEVHYEPRKLLAEHAPDSGDGFAPASEGDAAEAVDADDSVRSGTNGVSPGVAAL